MKLVVQGGDLRFAYLAAQAAEEGLDAVAVGLENAPVEGVIHGSMGDIENADYIIAPNPYQKGMDWPHSGTKWDLHTVMDRYTPGTTVLMMGTKGADKISYAARHVDLIDLMEDEVFVIENAFLSAEGALYSVMKKAPFSLYRTDCMVVGFGRIGAALTRMLTGLGARVTVAARRENARARARMFGAIAVDMDEMRERLPRQRVIFSTPPETVLFFEDLMQVSPQAMLVDLASPPYGFDMEMAKSLGIDAWLEPGIPGRYSPESAGKALLRSALSAIKEKEGGMP